MFDATKLLGALLEGRAPASMPGRLDAASRQGQQGGLMQQVLSQLGGASAGGGLGSLIGGMLGGSGQQAPGRQQAGAQQAGGGFLNNFGEYARRAAASPRDQVAQNNPAAIGGLGALAGAVLGGGRGAIGGGIMAMLGSIAYTAFQNSSDGSSAAPASTSAPGGPAAAAGGSATAAGGAPAKTLAQVPGYSDPAEVQRKARLMIRAMVQAAKADGTVDQAETARITGHIDRGGDGPEARAFVEHELRQPVDPAALARDVKSRQEALEVYAASVMAIDVDTDAERDYLAKLAKALTLQPEAVAQINAALNVKG
ncbi:tellurite resistance TerB family protein [Rhodopila sp.]|uniref:tellurite resistance TerB family protein n=1 Tax=Rhodopila sp. TaxID=2480087 RepID=UPI003D10B4C3